MTTVVSPVAASEVGPAFQWLMPLAAILPALTVAASGNVQTGVIPSGGYQKLSIGLTSSQAGALTIQRYLDLAGTIAQGAAISAALVAATAAVANVNDGLPFASFVVKVTNTGGSTATLSSIAAILQSA